jgi:PAS domain S-box-containing protein
LAAQVGCMQPDLISSAKNAAVDLAEAESVLSGMAEIFLQNVSITFAASARQAEGELPNLDVKYRALIEQLPAVVFMVSLDRGSGEAYVSPQIEEMLGYSQEEWLGDPIRWYERIHPDDKARWSCEASDMFLSGKPLRSVYRVIARDGHVISFHCEAKMVPGRDGLPWFIHGVAFDVTELKRAEEALQEERNFASALLDTVGALVVVFDRKGRIVRFNRACERITGYSFSEVKDRPVWELFIEPEERARLEAMLNRLDDSQLPESFLSTWRTSDRLERQIACSNTVLTNQDGKVEYVIMTGIDVSESKRLEKAILDISGREQRRIGQDLHDGLGQHLTGIAFMSKVLEQKLKDKGLCETSDAAKIVKLVNEAVQKTRELSRGLLPVLSDAQGLMSALEQLASEVEDLFQVTCRFECRQPVLIQDDAVAAHLYHIAREAIHNSIKHAAPANILVDLAAVGDRFEMKIEDDGAGFVEDPASTGMGLHIMRHRARMIGGTLEISRLVSGGSRIRCSFTGR